MYDHLAKQQYFPTRRSSDLEVNGNDSMQRDAKGRPALRRAGAARRSTLLFSQHKSRARPPAEARPTKRRHQVAHSSDRARSEEHTSELQSHSDLVSRLLLEE